MKTLPPSFKALRWLAAACCLCLVVGLQAFAETQLQQPRSINTTNQDSAVTPAGCCNSGADACCGNGGCSNDSSCCGGGSCGCEAICCPKKATEEVKKHYWEVTSKMVCIPGFRFECNWNKKKCCKSQGCCDSGCNSGDTCCSDNCCSNGKCCEKCPCSDPGTPTCGRVRCINVLEKHEYTCDECGYEWEVKCVRSGNGRSCCGKEGCCCPSCGCASTEAAEASVQLTSGIKHSATKTLAKKPSLSSRFMSWLK